MAVRIILLLALITLITLIPALAATDDAQPLEPNATFTLEFPELPPTLWSMHTETEDVTRCTVRLPENYSPERDFPLFVWLNGGAGGKGSGPGRGPAIMEKRDFIFVGMPLFQESLDRSTPANGLYITPEDDGETICHAYRTMLEAIYEAVPNIDTADNVFGGFSNGGHSIAAIVDTEDEWLLERMRHIVIVEGGLSLEHGEGLAGRNVLFMYGGAEDRSEKLVAAFEAVYERLEAGGANVTRFTMPETGHAFPGAFHPTVRDWAREAAGIEVAPEAAPEAEAAAAP